MNKKMIMLISALVCANNVMFTAQIDVIKSFTGLTAEEVKKCREEIEKIDFSKNPFISKELAGLLQKREAFLTQAIQANNQSSTWPYWIAALLSPATRALTWAGYEIRRGSYPGDLAYDIGNFLLRPSKNIYKYSDWGLPLFVYTIAPAIAFYGMYRKYTSLQNQQKELEQIRYVLSTVPVSG